MKRTILLSYAALLMTFAMSLYLFPPRKVSPPTPSPVPVQEPAAAAEPEPAAAQTVRVLHDGKLMEMDMEQYIVGVTAAEMPADFEPEALKAQAVAARTYALYCARTKRHPDADVCTDSACCQAWMSDDAMRRSWGDSCKDRLSRITEAVLSTRGEYLCYDGAPVFAAFHSSSAGMTEDCGEIWSPLPYLVSVDSPETAGDVPDYISYRALSPLDFRDTILHDRPDADFSAPETQWVEAVERDGSGRVSSVKIAGIQLGGVEMRSLFSLRSTHFALEYMEGAFLFTVTGFGHGVGMSQYGAEAMADDGADYTRILAHYYPGTTLVSG